MYVLRLQRLGQTMEEGTIVAWLIEEGTAFNAGDEIYEVATEKASVVVEATRGGRLLRQVAKVDDLLPVGGILAVIAEDDEQPDSAAIDALLAQSETTIAEDEADAAPSESVAQDAAPQSEPARVTALPAARRLAAELGIALENLKGTGPEGSITVADVRRASEGDAPNSTDGIVKERLTPVGRAMAQSMTESALIPQFSQMALVDVSPLLARAKSGGEGLSIMDYLIEAVLVAAKAAPKVLGVYRDGEIWRYPAINLALAAASDDGLQLPVLKGADTLDMAARGAAWRALVEKARQNRISPQDLSDGVIAISNLGNRGVENGTALLPPGMSAIVFFGSIEQRPVVVNGALEVRPTAHISVTFDHRIIDGVTAAAFTSALRTQLSAGGGGGGQAAPLTQCR